MALRFNFLDFFIDNKNQLRPIEFKKAILRIELGLLAIVVGIVYTIIDIANGIYINLHYYITLMLVTVVVLWLNKAHRFRAASIIFVLLINSLIYLLASGDTYRSGVYAYFIVSSITALTLFGYDELALGLGSVLLSIVLFVLAYLLKISPVEQPEFFSEDYVAVFFTTNFIVSLLTSSVLLYFLIKTNNDAEKALVDKNELLSKANAELDQFVYSASHDLRSPLSSIMGLVEIAKRSEDRNEILMCLNLIDDRVKVQDSFIHEIVNYARNVRMEFTPEPVQLKSLLYDVIDQLVYMKEASDVDIQVQVDDDVILYTDKNRMISILSNLIGNAIKYRDTSKSERFVKIGMTKSDHSIGITIEDNGQGVPPHFQDKIFEMFFRASDNSKGSGLGLFIVKETLDKMKGSITLTSEVGKGSCFTVWLPNN